MTRAHIEETVVLWCIARGPAANQNPFAGLLLFPSAFRVPAVRTVMRALRNNDMVPERAASDLPCPTSDLGRKLVNAMRNPSLRPLPNAAEAYAAANSLWRVFWSINNGKPESDIKEEVIP